MNVLFHLPILPPKLPEAEALSQEIAALQTAVSGKTIYLNPNQTSPIYMPRLLFGLQKLGEIRQLEESVDVHHFFNPDPFPYPILQLYKKPVVYSLSSGLGTVPRYFRYFARLAAVTVYDQRSLDLLQAWGLTNVHLVQSGIDASRFTHTAVPLQNDLHLMVASAPWTLAQFKTKGVDVLLETAVANPNLHLTFLWRGVLYDEMMTKVNDLNLGGQVTVINEQVDVNQILAAVHGTINLAADAAIIKAYPHSLLDSLAAGKPILVSKAIAMADDVQKEGYGVVVDNLTVGAVETAVAGFVSKYKGLAETAVSIGRQRFSQEKMITSFLRVYNAVAGAGDNV